MYTFLSSITMRQLILLSFDFFRPKENRDYLKSSIKDSCELILSSEFIHNLDIIIVESLIT